MPIVATPGELGKGMRSLHIALAANRKSAASHVVYDLSRHGPKSGAVILRVLHEGMEPVPRVLEALQDLD